MMFQTYLRRDWDNEIETGVELRAENQFLATCQAASVSVKCLGMSLLRLSEISPQLSDILCPASRCDDARLSQLFASVSSPFFHPCSLMFHI